MTFHLPRDCSVRVIIITLLKNHSLKIFNGFTGFKILSFKMKTTVRQMNSNSIELPK